MFVVFAGNSEGLLFQKQWICRYYPEESGWYSAPSQEYIRQIFLSKLGFN
jgi:hypothetical protein